MTKSSCALPRSTALVVAEVCGRAPPVQVWGYWACIHRRRLAACRWRRRAARRRRVPIFGTISSSFTGAAASKPACRRSGSRLSSGAPCPARPRPRGKRQPPIELVSHTTSSECASFRGACAGSMAPCGYPQPRRQEHCTHRRTNRGCTQGQHRGGTRQGASGTEPPALRCAMPLHAAEGVRILLSDNMLADPANAWSAS